VHVISDVVARVVAAERDVKSVAPKPFYDQIAGAQFLAVGTLCEEVAARNANVAGARESLLHPVERVSLGSLYIH
jgi:hypothetical protein